MSVDYGFVETAILFFWIGLFLKLFIFNLPHADHLNLQTQGLKASLKY